MKMFPFTLELLFVLRLWFPPGSSVKRILISRYGQITLNRFRRLEQADLKYRKLPADIDFLETCATYRLVPKFLRFKVYKKNLRSTNEYRHCQDKFIWKELETKYDAKLKAKDFYEEYLTDLKRLVSVVSIICVGSSKVLTRGKKISIWMFIEENYSTLV